ncbi:MAG: 50S ribosomal protein L13 [Bacteroidota bacterium]
MSVRLYKTKSITPSQVETTCWIVDANGQVVGRLASQIAVLLRGKHKPYYTPHINCGDKVIVINAEKVVFTGDKMENKAYLSYTGYPSGKRVTTPKKLLEKKPTEILRKAVKGMLPKNRLGAELLRNVLIYAGMEHPHQAQKPLPMPLKYS